MLSYIRACDLHSCQDDIRRKDGRQPISQENSRRRPDPLRPVQGGWRIRPLLHPQHAALQRQKGTVFRIPAQVMPGFGRGAGATEAGMVWCGTKWVRCGAVLLLSLLLFVISGGVVVVLLMMFLLHPRCLLTIRLSRSQTPGTYRCSDDRCCGWQCWWRWWYRLCV